MPAVFFQLRGSFPEPYSPDPGKIYVNKDPLNLTFIQSKTPGGYRGFRFSYEGGDSELFNYPGYYNNR